MSLKLNASQEAMTAESIQKIVAAICAEFSPIARAFVTVSLPERHCPRVHIGFYPDPAESAYIVADGPTFVDAINMLIDRLQGMKI